MKVFPTVAASPTACVRTKKKTKIESNIQYSINIQYLNTWHDRVWAMNNIISKRCRDGCEEISNDICWCDFVNLIITNSYFVYKEKSTEFRLHILFRYSFQLPIRHFSILSRSLREIQWTVRSHKHTRTHACSRKASVWLNEIRIAGVVVSNKKDVFCRQMSAIENNTSLDTANYEIILNSQFRMNGKKVECLAITKKNIISRRWKKRSRKWRHLI